MRILYCNKYNFPFSGTEAYMFAAMDLMRSKGHTVALFSMADPRGSLLPMITISHHRKISRTKKECSIKPAWQPKRFIRSALGERFEA